MKTLLVLKKAAEKIPYPIGKFTSYVPHSLRLGREYRKFARLIPHYKNASPNERLEYTLLYLNDIVNFAQKNIPFYQKLYGKLPIEIKALKDFEELPIITKIQVREYSQESKGSMLINTGGTSGEPMSFYIDGKAWAREWAHMHFIWGLRGYKPTDLMVTMLGKDLGSKLYQYNAVHNEIKINPYIYSRSNAGEIFDLFKKLPIKYFQGYPSSIYNFFRELAVSLGDEDRRYISSKIKCLFLSSEFPLLYMVDYLKNIWNLNYISWYGHSEMCVLAYDKYNGLNYRPFPTYGYAENNGGMLCGTSFHNYDMPLIRYATGDLIESKQDSAGMIEYFYITAGREGDFIEDKFGRRISLTALVFGRHHKIFNYADYLQISHDNKGDVTFYVSFAGKEKIPIGEVNRYFDLDGLNIDSKFVYLKKPVLTKAGKLKLRVTIDDIKNMEMHSQ
ncbi:MAG: CoF synthetase [Deltaproteobacteria bacterium]|nr:CoF synthetase [Deltaproteobacteria bacterium]